MINRIKNASGWTMRSRNFSRPLISCASTTGCARFSFCVEPSRRVMVRPFSCARSASVDGATMSMSLPSSASFSLKAFASVTAVTASGTLRPRRAA